MGRGDCSVAPPLDRGQSEVSGVVLLTGVIVVLSATVGGAIVLNVTNQVSDSTLMKTDINVTGDNVSVLHAGGETLSASSVEVIVRNASSTARFNLDTDTVAFSGDADGRFEPGERAVFSHSLTGRTTVRVIDRETNTVLGTEEEMI